MINTPLTSEETPQIRDILHRRGERYNETYESGVLVKYSEKSVIIAMKEYAYQELSAAREEIAELKLWKEQQFEVWNNVDEYSRNHPDIKIGESVSDHCLKLMKERDELKKEVEKLKENYDDSETELVLVKGCIEAFRIDLAAEKQKSERLLEALKETNRYFIKIVKPGRFSKRMLALTTTVITAHEGKNTEG